MYPTPPLTPRTPANSTRSLPVTSRRRTLQIIASMIVVAGFVAPCGAATTRPASQPIASGPVSAPRHGEGKETRDKVTDEKQRDENRMRDELRYLQTQVILFRMQHHGVCPGYPGGDTKRPPDAAVFLAQMTGYTNDAGEVSDTPDPSHCHGPYLLKLPTNPLTGSSRLWVTSGGGSPEPATTGACGWIYNPVTHEVAAGTANTAGPDGDGVANVSN